MYSVALVRVYLEVKHGVMTARELHRVAWCNRVRCVLRKGKPICEGCTNSVKATKMYRGE